ncbi:glycoside hydrolase family 18 chitinase [Streptomyces uncialis]|uniref:chitinase n=1 Tax=Streptomyces uncialis TaxID=1048205 RepID=A0A1Q4VFC6_9ACTN|nr:glycoside hydrolase family 18 chitinase [Streptomyces uncialis]MCX4660054.1 glycoside hydrolase family 18 chitinase [Streptomyces uncialis]OKH96520.1 chitinase [Streptomyces uncialis]WST68114.1 glycoside hydrolase family 18 chitinase [Streptomyces uncialis]WTE13248.1 glycoside hydrolase family 18 chitinase [Streptomyces uncialis]
MRFRHKVVAGLTTLVLPFAAMVGLATPASAAANATATFTKTQDWGSGFGGSWTVKNTGTTTLSSWNVEWDFPTGTRVASSWDATITSTGDHWTAKNLAWNGTLAPGATVTFGFNGVGPGFPSNCTLNGGSCDGGVVPGDEPPSAPGTPTASGITDTAAKLTWAAATDDKGIKNYDVLRDGVKVATVPPATTGPTSYTDNTLSAGTDYSYTVQARDTKDQTGPVSASVAVRTTGNGNPGGGGSKIKMGYFTQWGVYGRNYHVKNLDTSGTAAKITHINYAFGNVQNGKCTIGDAYADYDKAYTADQSVDGVADTWDQPLRGNFNQLRKLKAKHPHIKILFSFGGWTWSGGFTQAAQNPAAFAQSCYDLVEDPRWADVFDGIDLDWEYPNACGLTCDNSGPAALKNLAAATRTKFGPNYLVTAAITADGSTGGKIDKADYAGASASFDWYNVMTYDFFGSWATKGPTAPHSPLTPYPGIPQQGFSSSEAIAKLKAQGVPDKKLLLGIGFYGRGWTGVTQDAPGGVATGPGQGTYEQGIEDYKVLKTTCPATGTVGGTAYAKCGNSWWSYDTPATIQTKMAWAKNQKLGGAFFWSADGDTSNGELVNAIHTGLQ